MSKLPKNIEHPKNHGEKAVSRTTYGLWKDLNYTLATARNLMQQKGFASLPSKDVLNDWGYSGLGKAIHVYHGGFRRFREKMGELQLKHRDGMWQDQEYVLSEVQKVKDRYRLVALPSQTWLTQHGHSNLSHAIIRYHGGFLQFRKRLDEITDQKERGYWQSENHVVQELEKIIEQHGLQHFPTRAQLREWGNHGLVNGISEHHGGLTVIRLKMGYASAEMTIVKKIIEDATIFPVRVSHGKWQDKDYTLEQARKIMKKQHLDQLPSGNALSRLGYASLVGAINKYHGGFFTFRKLLGDKSQRKKAGTWRSLEFVLAEIENLKKKHHFDELPHLGKLAELGYSTLAYAIQNHHGGFHQFRKKIGEPQRKKKDGTWQDRDYVIKEALAVKKKYHLEKLPHSTWLRKNGYRGLTHAIDSYFGGFPAFRQLLGEQIEEREKGYWKKEKNVKTEFKKMIDEKRVTTFPSAKQFREWGYGNLLQGIQRYHGGLRDFQIRRGYAEEELQIIKTLVGEQ